MKGKIAVDGRFLKIIAVITMLIDHIGAVVVFRLYDACTIGRFDMDSAIMKFFISGHLLSLYTVCRFIGRIAFPIFCFLLVEGFYHTSDRLKYILRLAVFAIISEVPFDLEISGTAVDMQASNVMVTMLIGFVMMCALSYAENGIMKSDRFRNKNSWISFITFMIAGIFAFAGYLTKCDYGAMGIVLIAILYFLRRVKWTRDIAYCCYMGGYSLIFNDAELPALLSVFFMHFYNGEKGKQNKYFFYIFYPLHLYILHLITLWLDIV